MISKRQPLTMPLCLAFVLFAAFGSAQTVTQVLVSKSTDFVQTSTALPVVNPEPASPTYGGPFSFEASVTGVGLSGITAPIVTFPVGSGILLPGNSVPYNEGVLGFNVDDQAWNFGAPNFNNFGTPTGTQRNMLFSNGTYTFTIQGATIPLNLSPPALQLGPPPYFTLTGGTWSGGKYVVDVNDEITITSTPFVNFNANVDGGIGFVIASDTSVIANWVRFYSEDQFADNFISYTIPALTLTSGDDYYAGGQFGVVADKSIGVPGSPSSVNLAVFANGNGLIISAVGVAADTTPPVIASLTASPASLWPPNHKMVGVSVTASASDETSAVTTEIVSVTSSEPDNGRGDGDSANDIAVTGDMTVNLRAERSGQGSGRIYTIEVKATDQAGNSSTAFVTVSVPKNGK